MVYFQKYYTYEIYKILGLNQTAIGIFFNINDPKSQQDVSSYCQQARKAIEKDFVPLYLGAKHLDRQGWLSHNSILVNELFDLNNEKFAAIADATYIYCQKSSNNQVQRKTFSVQKNCHLVKPMVICASDGYIVDVFGPYPAKDNDATILRDIMKTEKDLDGRYFRDFFMKVI